MISNNNESIFKSILIDHKDIVMFALDHDFKYLGFNNGHKQIMKKFWNADIKIGDNMLSFVKNENERDKAKKLFNRALKGENFTIIEDYSGESAKALYWELNHSPILNADKTIKGLSVILTDKTEFIENQQKLDEIKKQLEQELKAKNKFFSIVSHNLKNVLYGNLLMSETLSKNGQIDKDKKITFIDRIYISNKSTYNFLKNLLDWSKSEQGEIKIKKEALNLYDLTTDAIAPYLAMGKAKKLTLEIIINKKDVIFGDKYTIENIIGNLFNNAVKFTPNNGKITIYGRKTANYMDITIKDNGVGIAEDRLSKIFNIDESHSTLGTNKEEGSGLGLILCKEFSKKNNGTINISSEVNVGSSFSLKLPVFCQETKKQLSNIARN